MRNKVNNEIHKLTAERLREIVGYDLLDSPNETQVLAQTVLDAREYRVKLLRRANANSPVDTPNLISNEKDRQIADELQQIVGSK